MAVQEVTTVQRLIGPAAERVGYVEEAAIGAEYFEDDTGLTYKKSVAGVWQLMPGVSGLPGGQNGPLSLAFTGEVDGSLTAEALPSKAGTLVRITAAINNALEIYIGLAGVTVKDGTLDATTGRPIQPGDSAWFFVAANLNELYQIASNATDDLIYEVYS